MGPEPTLFVSGPFLDELRIDDTISIPLSELDIRAVRAQGAGGQNVNKVATAIHLRFDIRHSDCLPEAVRTRLLESGDQRITSDGVLVIKSQESRSQERNRQAAIARLTDVIRDATRVQKPRKRTRPSKAVKKKRLDAKSKRSDLKRLRGKPTTD